MLAIAMASSSVSDVIIERTGPKISSFATVMSDVTGAKWGNPGNEALTFVTFNMNHEGVAAVLPGVPARTQ